MNIDTLTTENCQSCAVPVGERLLQCKKLLAQVDYYLKALRSERKSPKTIFIYKHTLYRFAKFIGKDEITNSDVRNYLISLMDAGLKPHSVHVHYRNLKTFFNWLIEDGVLKDNPMKHIKPPKLPKLVIKPFSRQDIDNILLVCSGTRFIDIRNMAIVLILLDTGIRLLELAGLKLSDVNNDGDILTVYGKGSKERRVHLGLRAQRALSKYIMLRGDEGASLWLTESKTPITRNGLQIDIRRIIERAEIKDKKGGPHTFRHTAAISFIRNGGNVYVLQEMLGHASQEMTRKYCSSIGIDDVVEAHRKFSPVDNL